MDSAPLDDVFDASDHLAAVLTEVDRSLRRASLTVPTDEARAAVCAAFDAMMAAIATFENRNGPSTRADRDAFRARIGHWLYRGRFWNRSLFKPHGYAGDFRIIEWMYDLDEHGANDPTIPGVVNCIDHLYATVDSVQGVWERRHWFRALLEREAARVDGPLRVLDIASGGARYIRDVLEAAEDPSRYQITVVDQDAAAIQFCRSESLAPWLAQVDTVCTPIKRLDGALPDGGFDVVISAGLLDYLPDAAARPLLALLASRLEPGGVLAWTNFHPEDASRFIKEWIGEWFLIFRDEDQCRRLFPPDLDPKTHLSENGALTYAHARRS